MVSFILIDVLYACTRLSSLTYSQRLRTVTTPGEAAVVTTVNSFPGLEHDPGTHIGLPSQSKGIQLTYYLPFSLSNMLDFLPVLKGSNYLIIYALSEVDSYLFKDLSLKQIKTVPTRV